MAPALYLHPFAQPLKRSSIIPLLPSFQTSNSLPFNFNSLKAISQFKKNSIICLKSGSKYAIQASNSSFAATAPSLAESNGQRHWLVVVKAPPLQQAVSKPDVIDYYVKFWKGFWAGGFALTLAAAAVATLRQPIKSLVELRVEA